jgi:DNA-binding XRE family transcriptional regulator
MLREARHIAGLTQEHLAELIGASATTVRRAESTTAPTTLSDDLVTSWLRHCRLTPSIKLEFQLAPEANKPLSRRVHGVKS